MCGRDPTSGSLATTSGNAEYLNRDQELARLFRAQRQKLDLENTGLRECLLNANEVRVAQACVNECIRDHLFVIGPEIAAAPAAKKNRALCAKIIEDAVYAALTELSEMRLVPVDEEDGPAKATDEELSQTSPTVFAIGRLWLGMNRGRAISAAVCRRRT